MSAVRVNESLWVNCLNNNIDSKSISHISLDIFDTILRRRCYKPSDVFSIVAKRVSNLVPSFILSDEEYRLLRLDAESKARRVTISEEIEFDDIFRQMPFNDDLRSLLKETELEVERDLLFADPVMKQVLINLQQHTDAKFVLTSDMYLPESFIKSVLDKLYPEFKYERLFLSSSVKKTKTTGNLFLHVLDYLKIKPEQLLHIGDNSRSDVKTPQRLGINTLYYGFSEESRIKKEREYLLYDRKRKDGLIDLARFYATTVFCKGFNTKEEISAYELGAFVYGPVLDCFCSWIKDCSEKVNVDKILCIAREGIILDKVIKHTFKDYSLSKVLFASRKSTAVQEITDSDYLNTIASFSKRFFLSVEKILDYLKLDKRAYEDVLKLNVSELIDEKFCNSTIHKKFIKLLFDNKESVLTVTRIQKEYIQEYIKAVSENKSFALVDLGPGGTIIHQLNDLLENKSSLNLMLYASHRYYSRQVNYDDIITPFFMYKGKNVSLVENLANNAQVIENFLIGTGGSTLSYRLVKDSIEPVLDNSLSDEKRINLVGAFEKGVFTYLDSRLLISKELKVTDELRDECTSILSRFVMCPTVEEVNCVGALNFDENFSNSEYNFFDKDAVSFVKEMGLNSFYAKYQENPFFCIRHNVYWPYGLMTSIDESSCETFLGIKNVDHQLVLIQDTLIYLVQNNLKSICLYGAGELGEMFVRECKKYDLNIKHILDGKAKNGAYRKFDRDIVALSQDLFDDGDVIVISSVAFENQIRAEIEQTCPDKRLFIIGLHR